MSGYVASARIVRSAPRLARSDAAWHRQEPAPSDPAGSAAIETIAGAPPEPVDDGRLAAIRERWAQLTFYLFDANAWR